jgi:hypothetical protein
LTPLSFLTPPEHCLAKRHVITNRGQQTDVLGKVVEVIIQTSDVRPSTPSTALEVMYGVLPLDLHINNCAQNDAIRVRPDTSWKLPVRPKARVSHGKYIEHNFPPGLWQADTDEISKEKTWGKRYTVAFPTKKVDMLPSGDYDAYTDGSLMAGQSGAGAYMLRDRAHFCSLRGNTKQATVF